MRDSSNTKLAVSCSPLQDTSKQLGGQDSNTPLLQCKYGRKSHEQKQSLVFMVSKGPNRCQTIMNTVNSLHWIHSAACLLSLQQSKQFIQTLLKNILLDILVQGWSHNRKEWFFTNEYSWHTDRSNTEPSDSHYKFVQIQVKPDEYIIIHQ